MFNRKNLLMGLCGLLAGIVLVYAADGTIHTWTGKGSRRGTVEMELRSPSLGSAANLIPGTDNANALGLSSARWSDVQAMDATVGDDFTATDLAILGRLRNTLANSGSAIAMSSGTLLSVSNADKTFVVLTSTQGALNLTGIPTVNIANATAGDRYIIYSATATLTFNDEGGFTGTALELGAATRALGVGDILELIYYNNKWWEIGFYNN